MNASDGKLWFTEPGVYKIGSISIDGVVTEYSATPAVVPQQIVAGPDGALWFTDASGGIGRITTQGVVTEYLLGNRNSLPFGITSL